MMRKVNLFGMNFIAETSYKEVVREIVHTPLPYNIQKPYQKIVVTPNVDQIVKFYQSEYSELFEKLKQAHVILPDGQPLVWLSQLKHGQAAIPARLTGSDFFPVIWRELTKKDDNIFFVLPNDKLGAVLAAEHENTYWYSPPFFNVRDKDEFNSVVANCLLHIDKHNPRYIFLGLGFPKQEMLALALTDILGKDAPYMFLLGASYEFYCGTKKRAPEIMQRSGMEFLFRLLQEPKRMSKRYLVDDLAFFPLAVREFFRKTPA